MKVTRCHQRSGRAAASGGRDMAVLGSVYYEYFFFFCSDIYTISIASHSPFEVAQNDFIITSIYCGVAVSY